MARVKIFSTDFENVQDIEKELDEFFMKNNVIDLRVNVGKNRKGIDLVVYTVVYDNDQEYEDEEEIEDEEELEI